MHLLCQEPGPAIVESLRLAGQGQRVAVGDSVRVEVHVEDQQGIARIDLTGFAIRGSAQLGTLTEVVRFEPKVVDLTEVRPVVRDSVITRYLLATGDSVPADGAVKRHTHRGLQSLHTALEVAR